MFKDFGAAEKGRKKAALIGRGGAFLKKDNKKKNKKKINGAKKGTIGRLEKTTSDVEKNERPRHMEMPCGAKKRGLACKHWR